MESLWVGYSKTLRKDYDMKKSKLNTIKQRCACGNVKYGLDCICEWAKKHPGNKKFSCIWCGIYSASEARCNQCEEYENQMDFWKCSCGMHNTGESCSYCHSTRKEARQYFKRQWEELVNAPFSNNDK